MKQKQKGVVPLIVVAIVFILLALGGGTAYYFNYSRQPKENNIQKEQPSSVTEVSPKVSGTKESSQPKSKTEKLTQTQNEFANWQEYSNDRYHYKVKYPADWYFIKEGYSPPPPTSIKLSSVSDPYPSAGTRYMSVGIDVDQALGRTLDNYEEIVSLKLQYYQETRLTVGGEPAAKIAVPDPNSSEPISVYVQHKDNIYRIVWSDNTDEFVQNRKLLEKILQTFIFTD